MFTSMASDLGSGSVRVVVVGYYSQAGPLFYNGVAACAVADSRTTQGPSGAFVGPFGAGGAMPDVDVVGTFNTFAGTPWFVAPR